MAIDPDVQTLLDTVNTRLDNLETGAPSGGHVDVNIQYVRPEGNDNNDGLTWGTAKLTVKAACTAITAATGGIVNVGVGIFEEEGNIPWNRGVRIEGTAVNGTDIRLALGADEHLFVSEPGLSPTEFLHWSHIRNMRLRGGPDAVGKDLIRFDSRVGENCKIENVIMHPTGGGNGIHTTRGGQPIFWNDIHSFASGGASSSIKLARQPGDVFHAVTLQNISGDNHVDALVYASGFYNENVASLTLLGVKGETGTHQVDTILLEDMQCPVTVIGASVYQAGGLQPNSLVKITDTLSQSNVSVNLIGCAGKPLYWIDDVSIWDTKVARLPGAEKAAHLHYRNSEVQFRVSDSSNQQLRLPRMVGLALADPPRYPPVPVDGQAAVYIHPVTGDLMILFGDGTSKTIVTGP
jgi:hypothetical protein